MSRLGTVYVTQAHFDVELGILRQIWRRMQKVRAAMTDLRSKDAYKQVGGTGGQTSAQLTDGIEWNMRREHDICMALLKRNAPFYPREIRQLATEGLTITVSECDEVLDQGLKFTEEWYAAGRKRLDEFDLKLSQIEDSSA
jgi:hypothetical protein